MKTINTLWILIALILIAIGCEQTEPKITVSGVWSRPVELVGATNGGVNAKPDSCLTDEKVSEKAACCASKVNGVVYLKIENSGGKPDRLLSATSNIAKVVEIHETKMEKERMSMQKIETGIEIPAGKTIEIKPGGYHIMLIGLKQALKIDEKFSVELEFEKSPPMTVISYVRLF